VLILFLIVTVNEFLKWEISHHFLKLRYLVLGDYNARMPGFWDKLIFQISKGSVAPVLRWSGKFYMGFVENLIFFVAVQKLWKSVHIWQSYHQLCNVLFFYGSLCIFLNLFNTADPGTAFCFKENRHIPKSNIQVKWKHHENLL